MFHHYLSNRSSLLLIFATMVLTACVSRVNIAPEDLPTLNSVNVDDFLLDEYKIGVGDSLNINVWRNPDLSTQVVVLPDGNISVPLAGDIRAAGQSTSSLSLVIKEELNLFIRQPEVTVSVMSASSAAYLQRVRITGAVNSPISINYSRGLTVLDVVLLSGGLSAFANGNRAKLYRKLDEEVQVYPIALTDILTRGELQTNYPLLPGDVITVPEKSF